jgi:hypothetical protein
LESCEGEAEEDMAVRFSGHESFPCRYAWLPKAVAAVAAKRDLFADEEQAMEELGVGKNMVRSIRFWVEATGMAAISQSGGLAATDTGLAVLGPEGFDRYLEDVQTLWLIHWNLASNVRDPLFAWSFLFSRWQDPDFTESSVLKVFDREAQAQSKKLSPITLQQHFQVFLHTYVPTRGRKAEIAEDNLDCPLTELDLIVKIGEREAPSGSHRSEPVYAFRRDDKPSISASLFAYCVHDYWERMLPNEKTVAARSIATGINSPGQIFKLSEEDIQERLLQINDATSGSLQYSASTALSQLKRVHNVDRARLLRRIYN